MKTNLILLLLMILPFNAKAVDVEGNIIKAAIAANELGQHIDHAISDMKSNIPYKTTTEQYGPTLYRVRLEYKLSWTSGFSLQYQSYLVMLATSGQSTIYSDWEYLMRELGQKSSLAFHERQKLVHDYIGEDPSEFLPFHSLAQASAEKLVQSKLSPHRHLVGEHTLLIGRASSINSSSILFRFEVVSETNMTEGHQIFRQYVIVVMQKDGNQMELFMDDPKYNNAFIGYDS